MQINYNASGYPIKRMIIDKTGNNYCKVSKAWDLCLIPMQVLSKCFPTIEKDNFYNRLKFEYRPIRKFRGIMHVFNTVYVGKMQWVCTIEYMYPAIYYKMSKKKIKKYLCKMYKIVLKSNCKRILPMSDFSKNRILEDAYANLSLDDAKKIENKIMVMHPPQRDLITEAEIAQKVCKESDIIFCFVGRDFWRKGGFISFEALKKLRCKYTNFRFVVISSLQDDGGWYVSNRETIRDELLKADFVDWYEELDNDKVIEIMKKSHIGLLPTYGDTYGFSVLEMQACGCPCITTGGFALSEINNNDFGWVLSLCEEVCDEYSIERKQILQDSRIDALSEMIETEILTNDDFIELFKKKAINSLNRIINEHNPDVYANRMEQIYAEAINMGMNENV